MAEQQLIWFDSEIDVNPALRREQTETVVKVEQRQSTISETLSVIREDNRPKTYQGAADDCWGWEELRDYVVGQIERLHGVFPREGAKEAAIFKRFVSEWGSQSAAIARYAFEIRGGMWKGAPIKVTRFTKGSDPYFAAEIANYLVANA